MMAPDVKNKLLNFYQLAPPRSSPQLFGDSIYKIIANNTDYFTGSHRNKTRKSDHSKVAWFSFYGGARDVLVATPSNLGPQDFEMNYVTTEMKHMYGSVDHNS